ncbi:MAG: GSU2403 family nucleotidyltransferase fold protein [Vulcanibacillus sp.]
MAKEFNKIISLLDDTGVLKEVTLIGSWAFLLYREKYSNGKELTPLRTRDIDILVKKGRKVQKPNLRDLFESNGFTIDFKGEAGYMIFFNEELNIEFLTDLTGRDDDKPYEISEWKINAQKIRYLNILYGNTILVRFDRFNITIPSPTAFAIQKLMILHKRKKIKRERDINQIKQLISLIEKERLENDLSNIFNKMIPGWRTTLKSNLKKYFPKYFEDNLLEILYKNNSFHRP